MKTKLALVSLIGLLISSAAIAQTNYKTVMVDTNGVLYRPTNFFTTNLVVSVNSNGTTATPTNFWTANSSNIASVVSSEYGGIDLLKTVARSKFNSALTDIPVLLTNINPDNGEGGWFTMYKDVSNTNVTATGQARLMRDVWGSGSGSGIPFGQRTVLLVVDSQFGGGNLPTNFTRVVAGAGLGEWAAVPNSSAIGYEMRQLTNASIEIRLIAHNNTNLSTSGWINLSSVDRYTIGVESKTNGTVNLYVGSQGQIVAGNLPTLRTNISGGPVANTGSGEANLMAGIFVNQNTAGGEAVAFWSAGIQLTE